ncbi:hypothetical protein FGO68_gene9785 [Halteria grandinella]|uniref:Uncharacterized protein n=1 Tax=Halteria grandinella TaxID=5974 RepID=A0A8J8NAU3_HALGN|nr:hypothetical protein FGO68_gene9785 [Halteria grandinella]
MTVGITHAGRTYHHLDSNYFTHIGTGLQDPGPGKSGTNSRRGVSHCCSKGKRSPSYILFAHEKPNHLFQRREA